MRKLDAMFKIRNGTEINNSKDTYNQMAGQKLHFYNDLHKGIKFIVPNIGNYE